MTFAPSKRFSQNFLTDPRTAQKIVDVLEVQDGDTVVEIGPGKGVLTERLLHTQAKTVVAIDLDPRAIDYVRSQPWAATKRLQLTEGDVLDFDFSRYRGQSGRLVLIGNIPYAITTPILFRLFELRTIIDRGVIMMQKEVAQRCVAGVGSKEYGIVSVATWYASQARSMFRVPPGAFFPKPSVTSAVVRFDMRKQPPLEAAFEEYMDFVRSAFSQRRKVLANSLASWSHRMIGQSVREGGLELSKYNLGTLRAEELTPNQLDEIRLLLLGRRRSSQ